MNIKDESVKNLLEAVHVVGNMVAERFNDAHTIKHKGTVDLVTEVDLASEKMLREELTKRFPKIPFHGEEGGGADWKNGEAWVVDPIDGTTNFANRIEHFAISVALVKKGEPVMGVVHNPITKETFYACQDGGAYLNGKQIHVNAVSNLDDALAVTGFPYNRRERMDEIITRLRAFLMVCADVRRFGSASLDLCYTAKGIYAIYWEQNLKPWDIAAGALILKEAGGKVSKFNGGKLELDCLELLATNGIMHEKALEILAPTL